MKEKIAATQVIIVLTEHSVLGALLTPYIAEKASDGILHLIEQGFHASSKTGSMNETERKAIEIASHYTDKYLMGVYSREKVPRQFLHKLSADPDRIKNTIRPFIEKKLLEMLGLICNQELPFYQKQTGSDLLYPHHAYHINNSIIETRFRFNVNDKTFNYQLECSCNGETVSLMKHKPVVVLTSSPATLLLGMELFIFHHIEASRLLPFTKKEQISVDTALTGKYIDNIVIPIARYHEITTNGLLVIEDKRACEAWLYIEETIYNYDLLRLSFHYADQTFTPDSSAETKKIVSRKEDADGRIFISYYKRDAAAEAKIISLLEQSGLRRINDAHFKLTSDAAEKSLIEWINHHREMLQKEFKLTSALQKAPYCLDDIYIEQSCDDKPDWFELHITVVIGDLRIPFNRFRKHILEEKKEYILPDGRVILIPEEWFTKYANLLELGNDAEKAIRLKHSFVGAVQSILLESSSKDSSISDPIKELPSPKGLKAQLRPYQQKGFSWMFHLHEQGFGGCLADDMGLGKTLQTLTLLQYIYKQESTDSSEGGMETVVDTTQEADYLQPDEVNNYTKGKNIGNRATNIDEKGQYSLFSFSSEEELLPVTSNIKERNSEGTGRQQPTIRKSSTLIVVPTSLLHNWRKEARRFTTLSMTEYNSASYIPKGHPELFFGRFHLIFTSYGMMRNNIDILKEYCFEYVVLDESQNIKNSDSLTFRSTIQLRSNHRLTLTGTPIENSLKDLWAQFHFLQPDLLGDESTFQKHFINPIRQGNQRTGLRLQQLINPFILRRSKREVAPELPPLTEEIIYCEMTEKQDELYRKEKNSLRNILLQQNQSTEKHQNLTILNGILRLRQLSCHPHLVIPDFIGDSGKMEQIIETFDTLRSEGHKVLIFSSFVKHLELIADAFSERQWPYALLTGSSTNRPEEIAHFTEQKEVQAFLISLKAGGVGLNLTQADYVFIIDPWWNPAAEAQAIARAHRIGQEKQVIAYRFITQGSIEEKILQLQEEKRKLAETFITDSDSLSMLTEKDWMDLLG